VGDAWSGAELLDIVSAWVRGIDLTEVRAKGGAERHGVVRDLADERLRGRGRVHDGRAWLKRGKPQGAEMLSEH
jgi:hypothetical protein